MDGHVGPPIPIQYTRCPDCNIDLRVCRPSQTAVKPYIFPTLTWLVPEWEGKDNHKAYISKDTKGRAEDHNPKPHTLKTNSTYDKWANVNYNANPVMTWPDPKPETASHQVTHPWETREKGPSKQLWQRPQTEHYTPLIPKVPNTAWEGTSQGRNGAERGLILSPETEPDPRDEDLPMVDPRWLGPLVE